MGHSINIFGIVHQHGGCGTEALGAIELLRSKGVAVRCIVPEFDEIVESPGADYLRSLGVSVVNYTPGVLKRCDILISFAEGQNLFRLIEEHNDRPRIVIYSDCMHYASDSEVRWHSEHLIDEFFFQTRALADRLGPEITRRAKKSLNVRHGYNAYINPSSNYLPLRFSLDRDMGDFTAIKVCRDGPDKYHPDTWRMFCGISAPADRKVKIQIAGWGEQAAAKIGAFEEGFWKGKLNANLIDHIQDPKEMAAFYHNAHVLVHVCDYEWEEAMSRVMLESIVAGVVVISDNRGGARELIEHGKTGFLVDSSDEASFYASKLAFDDDLRKSIAARAYAKLISTGYAHSDTCWPWWRDLLNCHGMAPKS